MEGGKQYWGTAQLCTQKWYQKSPNLYAFYHRMGNSYHIVRSLLGTTRSDIIALFHTHPFLFPLEWRGNPNRSGTICDACVHGCIIALCIFFIGCNPALPWGFSRCSVYLLPCPYPDKYQCCAASNKDAEKCWGCCCKRQAYSSRNEYSCAHLSLLIPPPSNLQ